MSEPMLGNAEIRDSRRTSMMEDIKAFHEKFGIPSAENGSHTLTHSQKEFRANFLLEELYEYFQAVGVYTDTVAGQPGCYEAPAVYGYEPEEKGKAAEAKALDALVDLVYVALGTAHIQNFDFEAAWKRVHEANMQKVLAKDLPAYVQGKAWRDKSPMDVVKPHGWIAPSLEDLL